MLVNNHTPASISVPVSSSPAGTSPNNVAEMVESWRNKGCDPSLMVKKIREYHEAYPVKDLNDKVLPKIPSSQTIKTWEPATDNHKLKVFVVWSIMCTLDFKNSSEGRE